MHCVNAGRLPANETSRTPGLPAARVRIAARPVVWCAVVAILGVAADVVTKAWALSPS
jgi:hypothetical protein